ncbi:hypothetical protein KC865_00120 [Candidatus Kaiserbacteria bacterium]|nr:hypothetical protein [Candidatus Kaiserbacteria bacterium]USN91911.1 MAG: hypothetical protein H6782_03485 [Candidatus Nomurabacteria bacterium]
MIKTRLSVVIITILLISSDVTAYVPKGDFHTLLYHSNRWQKLGEVNCGQVSMVSSLKGKLERVDLYVNGERVMTSFSKRGATLIRAYISSPVVSESDTYEEVTYEEWKGLVKQAIIDNNGVVPVRSDQCVKIF